MALGSRCAAAFLYVAGRPNKIQSGLVFGGGADFIMPCRGSSPRVQFADIRSVSTDLPPRTAARSISFPITDSAPPIFLDLLIENKSAR